MPRARLVYGPLEFGTKKDALFYLQQLKANQLGTSWSLGDTYQVLDSVSSQHPDRWLYPKASPRAFKVSTCPLYKTSVLCALWLETVEVLWPFSYRKCVVSLPKKEQVLRALQMEVRHQLLAMQDQASGRHELRYEGLDLAKLWDVFQGLEKHYQGKLPKVTPEDLSQEGNVFLLKDRKLALRWQKFHQEKANLEPVTNEEKKSLEFGMEAGGLQGKVLLGHNP